MLESNDCKILIMISRYDLKVAPKSRAEAVLRELLMLMMGSWLKKGPSAEELRAKMADPRPLK